jgi:oligopeptide transport system substrate-binding protein
LKKFFATFLFLIPILSILPADGETKAPVLHLRIPAEPETLDWNLARTSIETMILMNIMEGLVRVDDKLQVQPGLAESWTRSADGKRYIFKIRKGVLWSDGKELVAADFVTSWKRLLSPLTAAPYAYFLHDIEGAKEFNTGISKDFATVGIVAKDPNTLEVRLKSAVEHWIFIPSFWVTYPLRADVIEAQGSGWAKPGRMVTLGPYLLNQHDIDARISLKANPRYWGKRPAIETIEVLVIRDSSTAMTLYDAGKLDVMTDPSHLDVRQREKSPELKRFPYLLTGYLAFAVHRPPVTDARIRRAIAASISRESLVKQLGIGQAVAGSFVPSPLLAADPKIRIPNDIQKARTELKAAGLGAADVPPVELLVLN